MPWKVFKDGDQYCVHKLNEDGSKGESKGCHPSEEEASAHLKALYANVKDAQEVERTDKVTPADKKRAEKEYGDVEYADEENKKYPLDKKHIHAAWTYINMPKNAAKYGDKAKAMKAKIAAAFKRLIGHPPPSAADDKESEIPEVEEWMTHLAETVTTSENPQAMQAAAKPVEHDHDHMHGTLTHSHAHQHDQEHGIDGQMGKHDHPHADTETPVEDKKETPKDEKAEDKPKKEAVRTMVFGELSFLRESEMDKLHKTVGVTMIKPGWSIMGRYYNAEVLKKAVPLLEGTKCYVDHPSLSEDEDRPERSVADIAGYYRNVKQMEDGSVVGNLVLIGKRGDEMWPLVTEAATKKPDLIGVSINALARTRIGEAEGKQGVIVEELVRSFGTDIVTTPSAGGRFGRMMESGDEMTVALLQSLTYDEWRSANPEFMARIKNEMRTLRKEELETTALKEAETLKIALVGKDDELSGKDATITKLNESVQDLQKQLADKEQETVTRVSEALAELKLVQSKLPAEWCDPIKPQLLGKTTEDMDRIIEAEKKKYFAVKEPVQVTNAGPSRDEPTVDPRVQEVVGALHGDTSIVPYDWESPAEYQQRKRKLKGK